MDENKPMKTIFSITTESIISSDEKEVEATVGYKYTINSSFPELAYAMAGLLKEVDKDGDLKELAGGETPAGKLGERFIELLHTYYKETPDE
jgi:hypothetical protein